MAAVAPAVQCRFFEEIRRYVKAGISVEEALAAIAEDRGPLQGPVRRMLKEIQNGAGFSAACGATGMASGDMEQAVLDAAERSGRLEQGCGYLAGWLQAKIAVRGRILKQMLYPLLLLHMAVFVGPLPKLVFGGGVVVYLKAALTLLFSVYGIAIVLFVVVTVLLAAGRRIGLIDAFWRAVPVVRRIWRDGALGRFCGAMAAQLSAGIGPMDALPRAGRAGGTAMVRNQANLAARKIAEDGRLAGSLRGGGAFPASLLRGLEAAERTGQLEEEFNRWADLYREQEVSAWDALGEWLPKLLYLAIAMLVGWQIIEAVKGIMGGYMNLIESIGDGTL